MADTAIPGLRGLVTAWRRTYMPENTDQTAILDEILRDSTDDELHEMVSAWLNGMVIAAGMSPRRNGKSRLTALARVLGMEVVGERR